VDRHAVTEGCAVPISAEQICSQFHYRWMVRSPVLQAMQRVKNQYNGDVVVPLPDMDRTEFPAVANLLKKGVDQKAARIASTSPTLFCPPRDMTKKREVDAGEKRRKALLGWWAMNELTDIKAARRARHLIGYAAAPVNLRWDRIRGIPVWDVLDPLNTFPAPDRDPDCMTPTDTIFTYARSRKWLHDTYPVQAEALFRYRAARPDEKIVLLEYIDDTERVIVGTNESAFAETTSTIPFGSQPAVVLERIPNRAGMCTAVTPGMVSLDRPAGDFDGMIGMYQMSARLMALEVIKAEKDVFPDLVMLGHEGGQEPRLVGGKWKDGRTGEINVVLDGSIEAITGSPQMMAAQALDRLERAQRLDGGVPQELGGESTSNIRTGRRGDAVLSAALDFPLGEAQKLFASSYQKENKVAVALAKGYAGSRPTSIYVNWKGARGDIEFVPNELFTTDQNIVTFAHAGADLQGVTIMAGQLLGADVVSEQWVREILPIIDDPELEKDRIVAQKLDAALLTSLQQKAQSGEMAFEDLAWFNQQVKTNQMELDEAAIALNKRVQDRQASSGPVGSATGPQLAGTPGAQPGLAAGTPAAAQATPPTVPQPGQSQDNLASVMQNIRSLARPVPVR
jgi:hypothetical protein